MTGTRLRRGTKMLLGSALLLGLGGCASIIEDRFDFRPFGIRPAEKVLAVRLTRVSGQVEAGRAEFTYRPRREQLCFSQDISAAREPGTLEIRPRRGGEAVLTMAVETLQVTGNGIPSYWLNGCRTVPAGLVARLRAEAGQYDVRISSAAGTLQGRLRRTGS